MTIASYHALANLLVLFLLNMPNSSYVPHSRTLYAYPSIFNYPTH